MSVGTFLQDQVLGMAWLRELIGRGLSGLGVDLESRLGGSLHFFLYDVVNITVLLPVFILIVSYIQS